MEVLQKSEDESLKYKPGGRLDMSHGFLHHIRRNQIARDDYDRKVKQAKQQQKLRHTAAPQRPRRPDREVYNPRHRGGAEAGAGAEPEDWNESSSGTEQESAAATELFWLDYQADSGHVTSFIVYETDDPESVAARVERSNVLNPAMRAALLSRIGREMDERRDKR